MNRRTQTFLLLLFLLVLTTSCGTRRRLSAPAGVESRAELSRRFGVRITPEDHLHLYATASKWLGTPYRMGGNTLRGVDCSGFVVAVYREVYHKKLARTSAGILNENCRKVKRSKLREGDLVFFRTDNKKKKEPNHVGIYLKNGKFVHASSSKGVVVSSLSEPYYVRAWMTGGRIK
ncbi:MAG: C40 family peptidase [Tannerellaceae bacterium]|jgi:lipoprotein Spr|nr:C40 family peptidase [Tannerellaceae bacterium]